MVDAIEEGEEDELVEHDIEGACVAIVLGWTKL